MKEFIIRYWLEFVFSGCLFILGYISRLIFAKVKRLSLVEQGLQALLRDRIMQSCSNCINQKCCSIYTLENISSMYEQYHALGGNGSVTKLVNEIKKLPTDTHDIFDNSEEE